MKKLITGLYLLLIFMSSNSNAQDIIVLKNAEEIMSKVFEVDLDKIKYKKWENLEGPVYTLMTNEVFFIKYENGTKDVFGTTENVKTTQPIVNNQKIEQTPIATKTDDMDNEEVPYRYGVFRLSFGIGNFYNTVGLNTAFILGNRDLALVPHIGYGLLQNSYISNWSYGLRIQSHGYYLAYNYGYIGSEDDIWNGISYYHQGSSIIAGKEFFHKSVGLVTGFGFAWNDEYFNTAFNLGVVLRI